MADHHPQQIDVGTPPGELCECRSWFHRYRLVQGGSLSPADSQHLLDRDRLDVDAIRRKIAPGPFEAVNYHQFADEIVITASGHDTKQGWAQRALQRHSTRNTKAGYGKRSGIDSGRIP